MRIQEALLKILDTQKQLIGDCLKFNWPEIHVLQFQNNVSNIMKAIQMEGLQMNKTPYNVTHYRSVASDLLKICKLQHSAIDALFAMLIKKDKRFCPPDTGWIWKARSEGNAKIQETEWVIA